MSLPAPRPEPSKPSLLCLTAEELEALMADMRLPHYRGRQVFHWLHARGATSPEEMTDLPAAFRRDLAERFRASPGEIVRKLTSHDGLTSKLLVRFPDAEMIETVVMRAPARGASAERLSICVSTQAGCAMGCTFCATGQMGFSRQLDAGEIVCQVYLASTVGGRPVTHVVFMGMGEPLANYDQTLKAVRLLHDQRGSGHSARAMTISTVGMAPQIRRLAREGLSLNLAISLHSPFDEERSAMMPVNRRWPIKELIAAGDEYAARTGRRVSYEYVLIEEKNDTMEHARALGRLLRGRLCHVNLIPLNPTVDPSMRGPGLPSTVAFRREVQAAGVACTIRVNRGRDIDAACGQLRVREQERVVPLSRP